MSNKDVFRTWDDWVLLKLKQIGRSTIKQWASAMGYNHSNSLQSIIKDNKNKLKITRRNSQIGRKACFYEVKEGVIL